LAFPLQKLLWRKAAVSPIAPRFGKKLAKNAERHGSSRD
jgi:hypothetical protein